MFRQARIKLTAWYLAIIMAISLSFSGVIYFGINRELTRIETFQRARQEERQELGPILEQLRVERQRLGLPGFSTPSNFNVPDPAIISEARRSLIATLGVVNLAILGMAGLAGYFLAGRTLRPIKEMVDEQKEFISNASHELRTPLTSLKTETEVALSGKMTLAEATALLKSNLEEVNKMQALSNYLLKLNRYEEGREISMTKVDLREVVLNAIGKRKVKTNLKKSIVVGNKDALTELVTILLDNAFKYSPKGSEVSVKVKDGTIEVHDNGIGISKEDLPHIFDRFFRADSSRSKIKADGYGLGLSIAKSIAELHHGTIGVESKVGKGTTFKVEL